MFTKTLTLFLLPAFAAAQYGYAPPVGGGGSGTTTTSALAVAPTAPPSSGNQINIQVGFNETFTFNPNNVTANVGDLVTFYFPNFGITHSVTQSNFANPCTYLAANASTNASAGFDSTLLASSTFTLNITDTNPIWYFCKQVSHCGLGMVGSINAPTTGNTFAAYMSAALAIGANEVVTPDDGTPVLSGVDATPIGAPVSDASGASTPASSGAIQVAASIGFTLFAAVLGFAMA